jgi:hypothetical protein
MIKLKTGSGKPWAESGAISTWLVIFDLSLLGWILRTISSLPEALQANFYCESRDLFAIQIKLPTTTYATDLVTEQSTTDLLREMYWMICTVAEF